MRLGNPAPQLNSAGRIKRRFCNTFSIRLLGAFDRRLRLQLLGTLHAPSDLVLASAVSSEQQGPQSDDRCAFQLYHGRSPTSTVGTSGEFRTPENVEESDKIDV